MIRAFVDESGIKGTTPYFVMAGFLAPDEEWVPFSARWTEHCRQIPAIRYLKMTDAAKATGEFYGWSKSCIEAKLKGFVKLIRVHAHRAIFVGIDLAAHGDIHLDGPTRDVYFLAFYTIISGICWDVLEVYGQEKIDVVFDENVIFGPRVSLWYPAIREQFRSSKHEDQNELAKVLPVYPSFTDDAICPPLQAADVLAWLFRTALSGERTPFEWIAEELRPSVPMSEYATVFDRTRLMRQMEMSKAVSLEEVDLIRLRQVLGKANVASRRKRKHD